MEHPHFREYIHLQTGPFFIATLICRRLFRETSSKRKLQFNYWTCEQTSLFFNQKNSGPIPSTGTFWVAVFHPSEQWKKTQDCFWYICIHIYMGMKSYPVIFWVIDSFNFRIPILKPTRIRLNGSCHFRVSLGWRLPGPPRVLASVTNLKLLCWRRVPVDSECLGKTVPSPVNGWRAFRGSEEDVKKPTKKQPKTTTPTFWKHPFSLGGKRDGQFCCLGFWWQLCGRRNSESVV